MANQFVRVDRVLFDRRLIFFIPLYLSAMARFRLKKTLRRVIVSNDQKCYGYVNPEDTVLGIRLRQKVKPKRGRRPARYRKHNAATCVDTFSHEIAHLRFPDHDQRHRDLTLRILKFWAYGK